MPPLSQARQSVAIVNYLASAPYLQRRRSFAEDEVNHGSESWRLAWDDPAPGTFTRSPVNAAKHIPVSLFIGNNFRAVRWMTTLRPTADGDAELPRQRGFHEDEMVAQFRRCFVVGRDLLESERAVEA
ncbi:hypothetical protein GCM10007864_10500 [Sinorhizobium fredii]|nr:hypothetical protein GCM10007864_10500 [Sinorhizobium fredii]